MKKVVALIMVLIWFVAVPVSVIIRKNHQAKVDKFDWVEHWNDMKRRCQNQLGCYDVIVKQAGTIPVCECVSKTQEPA